MLVVVKEKEKRRGHNISCRRGNGCRCLPRCSERPIGYENEMIPYYEYTKVFSGCNGVDITTENWKDPVLCRNVLKQSYMNKLMVVAGLCTNASSTEFILKIYIKITLISYSHFSVVIRNLAIFSELIPFFYQEGLFLKENWKLLSSNITSIFSQYNDIAYYIKLVLMKLFLKDMERLLLDCQVTELDEVNQKISYYWHSKENVEKVY